MSSCDVPVLHVTVVLPCPALRCAALRCAALHCAALQENPRAAQKHLSSPEIMTKINKLAAAGILQVK